MHVHMGRDITHVRTHAGGISQMYVQWGRISHMHVHMGRDITHVHTHAGIMFTLVDLMFYDISFMCTYNTHRCT